jgi:hypothetical protein
VVGNTGWGRNNKVLRKSHGNRENPVPQVARTPLTYVGQALPGPSTPSLFIYSLILLLHIQYIYSGILSVATVYNCWSIRSAVCYPSCIYLFYSGILLVWCVYKCVKVRLSWRIFKYIPRSHWNSGKRFPDHTEASENASAVSSKPQKPIRFLIWSPKLILRSYCHRGNCFLNGHIETVEAKH